MNTILNLLSRRPKLNYNVQIPKIDTSFTKVFDKDNDEELQKILLLQQINAVEKSSQQPINQTIKYNITINSQRKDSKIKKISPSKIMQINKKQAINNPIKVKSSIEDEREIQEAKKMLNKPYIWGASPQSNKGADCSSLVCKAVFNSKKLRLPRTAQAQWQSKIGKRIFDPSKLKKGDVLYFHFPNKRGVKVSHTAIYAGNGEMIEASNAFGKVVKRKIPKRYLNKFHLVGIKRY